MRKHPDVRHILIQTVSLPTTTDIGVHTDIHTYCSETYRLTDIRHADV